MQPVIPTVKVPVTPASQAQSRRGSPKNVGEELFGILKSGRSRRRRKKRRPRSLHWLNVPEERVAVQQDAAAAAVAAGSPAATATGTRPQQAPPVGLVTGASLGPLIYTPASVPAPLVPTAAVAVPPEQRLQELPPILPQGVSYNARQSLLGREERFADVAAISPAVLSPVYGAAVVQVDPSPYITNEAPPMPMGASSESSKSLEDRVSGFGTSGALGPGASKLATTLFLTLVAGTLLSLLALAIFVLADVQQDHADNRDTSAELTDYTDLEGPPTNVHVTVANGTAYVAYQAGDQRFALGANGPSR